MSEAQNFDLYLFPVSTGIIRDVYSNKCAYTPVPRKHGDNPLHKVLEGHKLVDHLYLFVIDGQGVLSRVANKKGEFVGSVVDRFKYTMHAD